MAVSFYLLIRGPLGVGKTTVARRVAATLGAEYLSIDALLQEAGPEEWEGGYISEGSFLRANEIAADRARAALDRGVPVVLDGNFYWRRQVEDLTHRLPFPHAVFTLHAPLEVCIERDRGRPEPHGPDAARDVYAKVTEFPWGTPIDATGTSAAVVEALLAHVAQKHLGSSRPPKP